MLFFYSNLYFCSKNMQKYFKKSHGVVLRVLANHSIPLMISGEESNINETMLSSVQPFNQVYLIH